MVRRSPLTSGGRDPTWFRLRLGAHRPPFGPIRAGGQSKEADIPERFGFLQLRAWAMRFEGRDAAVRIFVHPTSWAFLLGIPNMSLQPRLPTCWFCFKLAHSSPAAGGGCLFPPTLDWGARWSVWLTLTNARSWGEGCGRPCPHAWPSYVNLGAVVRSGPPPALGHPRSAPRGPGGAAAARGSPCAPPKHEVWGKESPGAPGTLESLSEAFSGAI